MSTHLLMGLAMMNGILTSILLETVILLKQMGFGKALRTALGMSLVSMVAMELAMNAYVDRLALLQDFWRLLDLFIVGGV